MAPHGFAAILVTLTLLLPQAARAQQGHDHAHGAATDAALVSQMQLDEGRRWSTDEPLRKGMAEIRAAFDADHSRIHSGKQTNVQYEQLARSIEKSVNRVVEQCKLPPAADAQLHLIVGDLLQGVSLMRGADSSRKPHDGAQLVDGALKSYGRYFDDPAWHAGSAPHPAH
jgi:hypothetical protein